MSFPYQGEGHFFYLHPAANPSPDCQPPTRHPANHPVGWNTTADIPPAAREDIIMQNTGPWYRPDEDTTAHDIQMLVRAVFYAGAFYVWLVCTLGVLGGIAGA